MLLNHEPLCMKWNINLKIVIPCPKFGNVFSGYEPAISQHKDLQYFYSIIPSLSIALVDRDYNPSTIWPLSFSAIPLLSPSHLVPFSLFSIPAPCYAPRSAFKVAHTIDNTFTRLEFGFSISSLTFRKMQMWLWVVISPSWSWMFISGSI